MTSTQFNQAQFDSAYSEGIEHHYWSKARNNIIKSVLRRHRLDGKKILEIGCGRGIVVQSLRASGFNCRGVELADIQVPSEVQDYIQTNIDFANLSHEFRASIEVVLLLDVIEHIEDDRAFLQKVRNTFPALTHICITVPARQELWSNYDVYYGHMRRYTRRTLETLITAAEFRRLFISYFFHALYAPARFLSLVGLKRNIVITPPRGSLKIFHTLIARYFSFEFLAVPQFIVGSSIVAVVKVESDSSK